MKIVGSTTCTTKHQLSLVSGEIMNPSPALFLSVFLALFPEKERSSSVLGCNDDEIRKMLNQKM